MKRINKIKLLIFVFILLLVIGGTYAYWTWNSTENKNITFSTTGISDYIIYDEGESYFVGDYQPYDTFCESVHTTISIYKTNDAANMDLRASIKMDVNSIGDNIKASDNVYYVVTRGNSNITCNSGLSESNVISSGTFKNVSSGDTLTLANNIEITSNEVEYTIWIWIDSTGEDIASLSLEILDTNIWTQVEMLDGSSINSNDIVNVVVNDGMIPVVISNDGTVTTIYVWIPRYKYKIWTTSVSSKGNEQTIDIVFENKETPKSKGTKVGEYLTHPAFTFGTEELDGFWVGKFETTGSASTPTVLPNVKSLRRQDVSTQFTTSLKFAGGNLSNGIVTFVGNATYGLTSNTDSHMMKNSEWGSVAYLSHSIYGINDEVRINNNSSYKTGCGASTANGSETSSCEIQYGNATEYPQSTTGNITGIYDMAGGAWEYVMGVYSDSDGDPRSGDSSSYNSGFNGLIYDDGNNTLYTSGIDFPSSKYYDLYLENKFDGDYETNNDYCTLATCGGHALYEVTDWYEDYSFFVYSASPWFKRGGEYDSESQAGTFRSNIDSGVDYSYISWRSVLVGGAP